MLTCPDKVSYSGNTLFDDAQNENVRDLILDILSIEVKGLYVILTLTNISGEDVLIVDLHLNPIHEQAHVFWG